MKSTFRVPLPINPSALKSAVNSLCNDDIGYSLMDNTSTVTDSIRVTVYAEPETIAALKAGTAAGAFCAASIAAGSNAYAYFGGRLCF